MNSQERTYHGEELICFYLRASLWREGREYSLKSSHIQGPCSIDCLTLIEKPVVEIDLVRGTSHSNSLNSRYGTITSLEPFYICGNLNALLTALPFVVETKY